MSISRQNLSIIIVTLKSDEVIHQCIESIDNEIPIIVVENSNNFEFKKELESKYKNLQCILSNSNLGMGAANNIGINAAKTDYVFIINPDVILEKNTLEELFKASNELSKFVILSPLDKTFKNYRMKNSQKDNIDFPFEVDSVDGFSMLVNKKNFKEKFFFDENFFMYLENNDLCKRIIDNDGSIFIVPKSKINHLAAKAVESKFFQEIEFSRNWHWIWSKFYYNKKHFGFFKAFVDGFPTFFLSIFKYLFFTLINNKVKKKIYFNRASGFYNALIGNRSWYRPNFKD